VAPSLNVELEIDKPGCALARGQTFGWERRNREDKEGRMRECGDGR